MTLVLSPTQRDRVQQGHAEITYQSRKIKVYGKVGTLLHFGLTPVAGSTDLAAAGVDRAVTRKAHRRSRWFGDTEGVAVKQNAATVMFYPSRRGTALPGMPIKLKDMQTGSTWTLQVEGNIGHFISYLTQHRPDFDLKIWGKTNNKYEALLKSSQAAGGGGTGGSGSGGGTGGGGGVVA